LVSSTTTTFDIPTQTTFKLDINTDPHWPLQIRERATFTRDRQLETRAQNAFDSTEGPLVACESTHLALKALLACGLVVKRLPAPLPSTPPIAHYLVDSVLNSSSGYQGNVTAIVSDDQQSRHVVVPRRVLLLRELATLLNINIYLFSARRKATRFVRQDATATIALFHSIDSYLGHAEYLVLGASDRPILTQVHSPLKNMTTCSSSSLGAAEYRVGPRARLPPRETELSCEESQRALMAVL
jgi:hypothetical protein